MFLSVSEIAKKFNITKVSIRKAIKEKKLIAYYTGSKKSGYRINEESVNSWWESKKNQ